MRPDNHSLDCSNRDRHDSRRHSRAVGNPIRAGWRPSRGGGCQPPIIDSAAGIEHHQPPPLIRERWLRSSPLLPGMFPRVRLNPGRLRHRSFEIQSPWDHRTRPSPQTLKPPRLRHHSPPLGPLNASDSTACTNHRHLPHHNSHVLRWSQSTCRISTAQLQGRVAILVASVGMGADPELGKRTRAPANRSVERGET